MLNRQVLLLCLGIVMLVGTIVYALVPRRTDSRRQSLGVLGDRSLGSLKVPYGWEGYENLSDESHSIVTEFRGRFGMPSLRATAGPDLEADLERPSVQGALLAKATPDVTYYDAGRELEWSQRTAGNGKQTEDIVTIRLHEPPQIEFVFNMPDSTLDYDSTIIQMVDSYGPMPADPQLEAEDTDEEEDSEPPFELTDVSRHRQAIWICGAIVILFPLILLERILDAKQQAEFENEVAEHGRSIRAADSVLETTDTPSENADWQTLVKGSNSKASKPSDDGRTTIPFEDE